MRGYQSQMTRVTIESSRYENGQLLVSGTGMAGERFTDLVWYEPHGFHSRPHTGAVGYLMAPGGRREQGMVMAAADAGRVPQVAEGEAAMYDNTGKVVTLGASGWKFNMDVEIVGKVTITGNVEVDGNIHATGKIIDEQGNTNHHSH
ncbi:phage baseplate assembly protein [Mesorhizobium sp. KR2-14]|uniref:phage baseplate assembly protein domain-containing protein n=1 Tax=Mesorhizobium sp. KR2-14 TaxID=3156610 RepID=UPI0032B31860